MPDSVPKSPPSQEPRLEVPLSRPDIGPREVELVNQVLSTPFLSGGPMLERFEAMTARYVGTRHAVAVANGTCGLHLCTIAAGLGPGDEVITTPFSFIASSNCLLYVGARPVFVDIDPHTLNLDPNQVEEVLTSRTRALLPVHIFGQPCDMEPIMDIARQHNLVVIEDACEAIGARFKDRQVGTFGQAAVFAFYPNKQMTTGEGGIVVTNDPRWASHLRSLRNQGRDSNERWLTHPRLGYNYRLDELSCALGVAQMERLEELLGKREQVAQWYNRRLAHMPGVKVPWVSSDTTKMSWFVYVIRLSQEIDRQQVSERLKRRGIATQAYFPAIHLQPFYRAQFDHRPGDFPITEQVASSTLALPFHSNMDQVTVDYVATSLAEALAEP